MNILDTVLVMGVSQGLIFVFSILSLRPANPSANRYLALFVGIESTHLLLLFWVYTDSTNGLNSWLNNIIAFRALAAPILYLYIRAVTDNQIPYRRVLNRGWFVVPLLIWFALLLMSAVSTSQSTRPIYLASNTTVFAMLISCVMISYCWAAHKHLVEPISKLKQKNASPEGSGMRRLQLLILVTIFIYCSFLVLDYLYLKEMINFELRLVLGALINILLINLISIGGLTQPAGPEIEAIVMDGKQTVTNLQPVHIGKYEKSGLDETKLSEIWEKLKILLEEEKPYLEYSLDLPMLAKMLGVSPQELSQTINTASTGSFYQLISQHRIFEAKSILANPKKQHLKMLDIALEVGFSNQSTFYNQFKKLTTQTPKAYRLNAFEAYNSSSAALSDTGKRKIYT